jgi:hypothetical protein
MTGSTHLSLSWLFASRARASGKSDLTGHRPIWSLMFLLFKVSHISFSVVVEWRLTHRLPLQSKESVKHSSQPSIDKSSVHNA